MSTCLVGTSSRSNNSNTPANSFSVATTTNWLVRWSPTTLLRLSDNAPWMETMVLVTPAYLSWMTQLVSGSSAAGFLALMVVTLVLGFSTSSKS